MRPSTIPRFTSSIQWVQTASQLIKRINQSKINISSLFPNREYLHTNERLNDQFLVKKLERNLYDVNIEAFVNVQSIEQLIIEANYCKIDKGNILFQTLKDIYSKAQNLRIVLKSFESCAFKTFAEAKSHQASLVELGVNIPESKTIREMVNINSKISSLMSSQINQDKLQELKNLTITHSRFIDTAFKKDILNKWSKIEEVQKSLTSFLSKPYLYFDDYNQIEHFATNFKHFPVTFEDMSKIEDLYNSFTWVIKVALQMKIQSQSLSNLVEKVRSQINLIKGTQKFALYRSILKECCSLNYSKAPIFNLMMEVKLIFWLDEARILLSKKSMTIKQLEEIKESSLGAIVNCKEYLTVYNKLDLLLGRLINWQKNSKRALRIINELFKKNLDSFKNLMKTKSFEFEKHTDDLIDDYDKNLTNIDCIKPLADELKNSKIVIQFCKTIYSLFNMNKISQNEFYKVCETLKTPYFENQANSPAIIEFIDIKQTVKPSQKLQQNLHFKILKVQELEQRQIQMYRMDVIFIEEGNNIYGIDRMEQANEILQKNFIMDKFSEEVSDYLSQHRIREKQICDFIAKNTLSSIMSIYQRPKKIELIKKIKASFEEMKDVFRFHTNSDRFKKAAEFEWSLEAQNLQYINKGTIERIKEMMWGFKKLNPYTKLTTCNPDLNQSFFDNIESLNYLGNKDVNKILQLLKLEYQHSEERRLEYRKKLLHPLGQKEVEQIIDEIANNNVFLNQEYQLAQNKLELIQGSKLKVSELLQKRISDDFIEIDEVQNLYSELISSLVILPEEEMIQKELIEGAENLINESLCLNKANFDSIIEKYKVFGVKIPELEEQINKREQAFNIFNTFEGQAQFNAQPLKDILEIEEKILKVPEHKFYQNYKKKIIIRKARLIKDLSSKTNYRKKDDFNFKLTTLEFKEIIAYLKEYISQGDKLQDQEFWADHILTEKSQYISQLESANSRDISILYCKRILFNFLDISPDIALIKNSKEKQNSLIEKPDSKETSNFVSVSNETSGNNEYKYVRPKMMKELELYLKDFLFMSSQETHSFSRKVEEMIYHKKSQINITEYEATVNDFCCCMNKVKNSLVLSKYIYSIGYDAEIQQRLLGSSSDSIKRIIDQESLEKMLNLNNSKVSPMDIGSAVKDEALGKRSDNCLKSDLIINLQELNQEIPSKYLKTELADNINSDNDEEPYENAKDHEDLIENNMENSPLQKIEKELQQMDCERISLEEMVGNFAHSQQKLEENSVASINHDNKKNETNLCEEELHPDAKQNMSDSLEQSVMSSMYEESINFQIACNNERFAKDFENFVREPKVFKEEEVNQKKESKFDLVKEFIQTNIDKDQKQNQVSEKKLDFEEIMVEGNLDKNLLENMAEKDSLLCTEECSEEEPENSQEQILQKNDQETSSNNPSPKKEEVRKELSFNSFSAKPKKKQKITKQKVVKKPTLNLKNSTPSSNLNTEPIVDDIFDMIEEKEAPHNPNGIWCTYSGKFCFQPSDTKLNKIEFLTEESFDNIINFERLPRTVQFHEFFHTKDLNNDLKNIQKLKLKNNDTGILSGFVRTSKSNLMSLKKIFHQKQQVLFMKYQENFTLYLMNYSDLTKNLKTKISVKNTDGLIWIILSSNTKETNFKLTPNVATENFQDTLEYESSSDFMQTEKKNNTKKNLDFDNLDSNIKNIFEKEIGCYSDNQELSSLESKTNNKKQKEKPNGLFDMTNIMTKDSVGRINDEDLLKSPEKYVNLLNYDQKNNQNISNKSKNLDFNNDDPILVDFNLGESTNVFNKDELNMLSDDDDLETISIGENINGAKACDARSKIPMKLFEDLDKLELCEKVGRDKRGQNDNKNQQNVKTVTNEELKSDNNRTIKHGIMYRRSMNK